ncbi:MAG: hypothetical protein A2Y41_02935 [Spirochaetes bacterium GWB1_36_13]|nr:MAG: hypothetical protein A2Y41_02935 [Spirochaetes bacterium GWB1_36_13]
MKKLIFSFALFLILSGLLFIKKGYLIENPFDKSYHFNYPSFSAEDSEGNIYLIDKATTRITKMKKNGEVLFVLEGGKREKGDFYYTGKIFIDEKDFLYVFNFVPNITDGLLEREEIIRFSPKGKFDKVLVSYQYGEESKKRRESIIKFYVKNDSLFFYYKEEKRIALFEAKTSEGVIKTVFDREIEKDIVDITGTEPGNIYFTTKKGLIFKMDENLKNIPIAIEKKNFIKPAGIEMDRHGNLFIADMVKQSIFKIHLEKKEIEAYFTKNSISLPQNQNNILLEFLYLNQNNTLSFVDKYHKNILSISKEKKLSLINQSFYGTFYLLVRYILWFMGIIAVLSLLYTLSLFYKIVMKKKIPLVLKNIIIFTPLIIASVVFTGNKIYQDLYEKYQQEFYYKLLNVAGLSSQLINGNTLEKINSPEDFMNEDYQTIDHQAQKILNENQDKWNDSFYLVIYRVKDGIYYIDYTLSGFYGVMYPYLEVQKEHRAAFEKGEIGVTRYYDEMGGYLAGIAPIKNSKGEIVGVLDIGIDLMIFEELNANYKNNLLFGITFSVLVFIIIFILISYLLLISIKKLRSATHKIIMGNLDIDIQIRSKDEIEELGKDFNKMSKQLKETITKIINLNKANARFVPTEFFKFLKKESILDVTLGDQTQEEMTILFSDIRSFTSLSEKMSPQENFNFLNTYLSMVAPAIRNHNGFIDKYIGDAIMALFPGNPANCLKAAFEMLHSLKDFNKERIQAGEQPIEVGIGMHTGNLMLGIIGEKERLDSTVISDAVNLASRLEGLTKMYGASIVMSESTLKKIKDISPDLDFHNRFLDQVKVKGKNDPVFIYEVFGDLENEFMRKKLDLDPKFQEAVSFYQKKDFKEALTLFVKILSVNPKDKASEIYLKRCEKIIKFGVPEDWDGIEKLDEK